MNANEFVLWFSVVVAVIVIVCAIAVVNKYNSIGRD